MVGEDLGDDSGDALAGFGEGIFFNGAVDVIGHHDRCATFAAWQDRDQVGLRDTSPEEPLPARLDAELGVTFFQPIDHVLEIVIRLKGALLGEVKGRARVAGDDDVLHGLNPIRDD